MRGREVERKRRAIERVPNGNFRAVLTRLRVKFHVVYAVSLFLSVVALVDKLLPFIRISGNGNLAGDCASLVVEVEELNKHCAAVDCTENQQHNHRCDEREFYDGLSALSCQEYRPRSFPLSKEKASKIIRKLENFLLS